MKRQSRKQQQIQWRRNKVEDYLVQGLNQHEISEKLQVSKFTISIDVGYLREQAKEQMKNYVEQRLPLEFHNCLRGIDYILKSVYEVAQNNTKVIESNSSLLDTQVDERLRLQALQLVNECYKHKIDLVTNGTIVQDALRFVQQNKKSNKIENNNENTIAIETF